MLFLAYFGSLHPYILLLTALVIVYSDHQGYLYFRGKKELLSERFVYWSHRLVWAGLLLMIATGASLAVPQWQYLIQEPVFFIKMGFVLVLLVNAIAIGNLTHHATERSFNALTQKEKQTLIISGALSSLSWVGAAVIGFFFL